MTTPNKPSRDELIDLVHKKSVRDIAKMYGVTSQAVYYWLRDNQINYTAIKYRLELALKDIIIVLRKEGHPWHKISKITGTNALRWARLFGLETEQPQKPIGCNKCIAEPYAKGLCKACYERQRRHGNSL